MQAYVVGFCFSPERDAVVLVRKQSKPGQEWQAGKLNGVGGKVEPGETPLLAMRREFEEEAGIAVLEWDHFATWHGKGHQVFFYRTVSQLGYHFAKTMEAEPIVRHAVVDLLTPVNHAKVVPNLAMLLTMALNHEYTQPVVIRSD